MDAAASRRQVTLPVTGMTCANCVTTIERNLRKVEGVEEASVSLASERAQVVYDPSRVDPTRLVERVRRAGYDVALGDLDLSIHGLADDNDARRLEQALRADPAVVEVQVNYAAERARLRFLPTLTGAAALRRSIEAQGFQALERGADATDVERATRTREIRRQQRRLAVGLAFTIPLFALSMAADFGLLPMALASTAWFALLSWALATPVQFYVGGQYYGGAFKALRNRSANMDVLIAMGSSAAYFYSVAVVLGWASGHLYFET
ncbi:MAG TPA: cation transporter, partial [Anaerolineales bacterium]|nr:cation transporter [Anaerolineales bacterium]